MFYCYKGPNGLSEDHVASLVETESPMGGHRDIFPGPVSTSTDSLDTLFEDAVEQVLNTARGLIF